MTSVVEIGAASRRQPGMRFTQAALNGKPVAVAFPPALVRAGNVIYARDIGAFYIRVAGPGGLVPAWTPLGGGGGGSGPPTALAYFDGLGSLTGDPALTPLGTSYGRPQIHDVRQQVPPPFGGNLGPNVVWRQGALSSDGDAFDLEGDGIVIYGPGPSGTMTGTNWTFARIKSDRFAIRSQILGVDIGYMWRVDPTEQYFKDDLGNRTYDIQRATGVATFRGVNTQRFAIKEGADAAAGVTALALLGGVAAVVVPNTSVTAASRIVPSYQPTPGPGPFGQTPPTGVLYVAKITPGVSFVLASTSPADAAPPQNVYWEIIEPAP